MNFSLKGFCCKLLLSFLVIACPIVVLAQDDDWDKPDKAPFKRTFSRYNAGIYLGTLFANSFTAGIYDGYGYDLDGNRNDFFNSFMYRKIVTEYGGANNQQDQIAKELGVGPNEWTFDESDMPINLDYNIAYQIGLATRFCLNKKESIIFNMNASKLGVAGSFTITTTSPTMAGQTPTNIKAFSLIGGEQRLVAQLGYQRIFGDEDGKINFFLEGGLSLTLVKFEKNRIKINNLDIDLMGYYHLPGYQEYSVRLLTGYGLGAFAGAGLNLCMSSKWTIQMVYNPSYEVISLGPDPKPKIQNSLGLRAYYNF